MIRTAVLFALALMMARPALGQGPLTLDEAIARTLERNPSVRAARAALDEARARRESARGGYFPHIDLTEAWQRGNQPVYVFGSLLNQRRFTAADFALDSLNHPDALSNYRVAVTLRQSLYDGSRTRGAVRVSTAGEQLAESDVERTTAELRLAATQAFARALSALAMHRSAQAALEAATEDLRRTEARRDAGLETEANVLALRVRADGMEARRIAAASEEAVARAALNALMDAPLAETPPLAEPALPPARTIDAEALEATAVSSRAEIRQAALRHTQAVAMQGTARGSLLPRLSLLGSAEANGESFGDRSGSWGMAFEASWSVFAGGSNVARLREATAAVARAEAEHARAESAVRLEVRAAIAEYQAALAREITGRRMVDQARESQRIMRDRYDAGLAQAADLLRAAEAVTQAEAARVTATAAVHVTSAALDRAVGTTGPRS